MLSKRVAPKIFVKKRMIPLKEHKKREIPSDAYLEERTRVQGAVLRQMKGK
jgi:hypothetical protein